MLMVEVIARQQLGVRWTAVEAIHGGRWPGMDDLNRVSEDHQRCQSWVPKERHLDLEEENGILR